MRIFWQCQISMPLPVEGPIRQFRIVILRQFIRDIPVNDSPWIMTSCWSNREIGDEEINLLRIRVSSNIVVTGVAPMPFELVSVRARYIESLWGWAWGSLWHELRQTIRKPNNNKQTIERKKGANLEDCAVKVVNNIWIKYTVIRFIL